MSGYLVDTNIPSELTRLTPEPAVVNFLKAAKAQTYLSALSLGEIRKGISSLSPGARRASLENWLDTELRPWFGDRVLPITGPIAERWGNLAAESKLKGKPLPIIDGLIAATALVHGLIVVTRNTSDYDSLGASVHNPWPV